MQNKKALVMAVGFALAMPAAYAAKGGGDDKSDKPEPPSIIELYGRAYPEFIHSQGKDATPTGTTTCTICAAATG